MYVLPFELNTIAFDYSWFTSSFQEEQKLLNTFKEFCSPSCVLCFEPILFKLYINNIVDDLEKAKTDPVIVGDVQVNSLLYADDIILLSSTQEGLQNSLNVSSNFCSSWKLDVSQEKSKASNGSLSLK
jgi:hypothetical protein